MDHQLADFIGHLLGAAIILVWGGLRLIDHFFPRLRKDAALDGRMDRYIERLTLLAEQGAAQHERIEQKADTALGDHRVIVAKIDGVAADLRALK